MDNTQITSLQGLEVLAQALAQFRGTRQEHELLERSFRAVETAVKAHDAKAAD
jgi:hypothetical protein